MPEYVFSSRGSTRGLSGRTYTWWPGEPVHAPEGEFGHMEPGTYQIRPAAAETRAAAPDPVRVVEGDEAPAKSAPLRTISHAGGGYYALAIDGDEVGRVRGKADAEAWQDGADIPDIIPA